MSLWERDTRVPMIISGPKIPSNTTSEQPVGLIDIYPTLVDLAQLPTNEGIDGQSLTPLINGSVSEWSRPAITQFGPGNIALRTEFIRYIRYEDGSEELYDHRSDPDELNNLIIDGQVPRLYEQEIDRLRAFIPDYWSVMAEQSYYKQNAFVRERIPNWKKDANQYINQPLNKTWRNHKW